MRFRDFGTFGLRVIRMPTNLIVQRLCLLMVVVSAGCVSTGTDQEKTVVVYTSVDDMFARPIAARQCLARRVLARAVRATRIAGAGTWTGAV